MIPVILCAGVAFIAWIVVLLSSIAAARHLKDDISPLKLALHGHWIFSGHNLKPSADPHLKRARRGFLVFFAALAAMALFILLEASAAA